MLPRRTFLKIGGLAGAGLLVPWQTRAAYADDDDKPLLDPLTQPRFVNPLPNPAVIDATGGGAFELSVSEFKQWLGLVKPNNPGTRMHTPVWGYDYAYPGPTILARRDVPVEVLWHNRLPSRHLLPIDQTVHWANPDRWPGSGIPIVTHLHGGHTESDSDGLPEAWYTRDFRETGAFFVKPTQRYDNDQEAATLWYHDHALGITRLNVYAGMAGFYLLRDDFELDLIDRGVLPAGPYERGMAIQDRMFTRSGRLFLPTEGGEAGEALAKASDGAPNLSIVAEFFGDFILVNGMTWPVLDVEPRKYRLRFLNGSDSRFYILQFGDDPGLPFFQIGTDNGFLEKPVPLTRFVFSPGERADLIVDFAGQENQEFVLKNFGPDEPFKGLGIGNPADPATTGQVMKFRVSLPFNAAIPNATIDENTVLNTIAPLTPSPGVPTRKLVLFEGEDEFGRLRPQLGTLAEGSLLWDEVITETPRLNDTEVWEVYNATEDAHPIHLHLVTFQILNREAFTGEAVVVGEDPLKGGTKQMLELDGLSGIVRPPDANEIGWKDTARMLPGDVTRIIARFDRPGRYVWHCHILSHEDHEMMRPFTVTAASGPTFAENPLLEQNTPNPFNPTTTIRFRLPEAAQARLEVFDMGGKRVAAHLIDGQLEAGQHEVRFDGSGLASGVYLYRLTAGHFVQTRRMTLLK